MMRYNSSRSFRQLWRYFCTRSTVREKSEPRIVSAEPNCLYVSVDSKHAPSVDPDLDLRQRFSDLDALRRLLELRGYNVAESFGDLRLLSRKYHEWYQCASKFYETYRRSRVEELRKDVESEEFKIYNESVERLVRLERECVWTCLRLPADLHPWTPKDGRPRRLAAFVRGQRMEIEQIDPDSIPRRHHMELMNLKRPNVEFASDPPQCFIIGRAAQLLRALERYFNDSLYAAGYRLLSPAHFVRSSMIEAYFGSTHHPSSNDPYYLPVECINNEQGEDTTWALWAAGHGPAAYLAFLARKEFSRKNAFPLKYSSIGMAYSGRTNSSDPNGWDLYDFPIQRPRVTLWTMYQDDQDSDVLENITSTVQDLLSKLKLSFTVDQQPSDRLLMPEMSRADFHVPVRGSSNSMRLASISGHGDYISKRIRMITEQGPGGKDHDGVDLRYLRCCYGEIDLYKLLAKLYEEMHPNSDRVDLGIEWWPLVLHAFHMT